MRPEEADAKLREPGDFTKGSFAFIGATWCKIKRVNKRSINIGAIIGTPVRKVYRIADNHYGWTDSVNSTKVKGRRSAEESTQ